MAEQRKQRRTKYKIKTRLFLHTLMILI